LAAILDWAGYLKEGEGYRSFLPVTVDGTCNGLQHLTALIRDHKAAPLVNLLPSKKPADIYATIAAEWQKGLAKVVAKGGEPAQQATWFLGVWGDTIQRSATKRQVMVLPYGGSRDAFFTYTKEAVVEMIGPPTDDATPQHREFRNKSIGMASRLLWAICNKRLPGAMALMKWLQDCSKLIVEGNQPIYWVTPSGFVVRHFYGRQQKGLVRVTLNGRKVNLVVFETTKDLDPAAQTRGVPPNFVHSLDAAALALTVNACPERGISHITGIHDAYGTHAADMNKLAALLREAFVDVHEREPIEVFWEACRDILEGVYVSRGVDPAEAKALAEEQRPAFPEVGTLDIRQVLKSAYFFS
jgi:DNA-directed RNA polymerase